MLTLREIQEFRDAAKRAIASGLIAEAKPIIKPSVIKPAPKLKPPKKYRLIKRAGRYTWKRIAAKFDISAAAAFYVHTGRLKISKVKSFLQWLEKAGKMPLTRNKQVTCKQS